MKIGQLIRERRKALGMSQAELAKLVGSRPNWISMIESGSAKFPKAKWKVFADALRIDPTALLNLILKQDIPEFDQYVLIRFEDDE